MVKNAIKVGMDDQKDKSCVHNGRDNITHTGTFWVNTKNKITKNIRWNE